MARNRMIKPEFWCDKKTNSLAPIVQLLFIGTWNFADDTGVCRADITYLQSNIFPYTSVTRNQIKEVRDTLIEKNLVYFGIYNDEEYILIKNFNKHQKIDHPSKRKNIEADYKAIFGLEANTRRVLAEPSPLKKNENEKGKEKEKILPISLTKSDKSWEKNSFSSFSDEEKQARLRQFYEELEEERRQKANAGKENTAFENPK